MRSPIDQQIEACEQNIAWRTWQMVTGLITMEMGIICITYWHNQAEKLRAQKPIKETAC